MAVQLHLDYPPNTRAGNTCSCCGCGHRMIRDEGERVARPERIVDFGIQIDFEGYLMLCEQCVLEAAASLGWVSPQARDAARIEADALAAECNRLSAERDEARLLVSAIRAYDVHEVEHQADEPTEVVQPEPEPEPERKTKTRAAKVGA